MPVTRPDHVFILRRNLNDKSQPPDTLRSVSFAHEFKTLTDDVDVFYQMAERHDFGPARGHRWDAAIFGIDRPIRSPILSPKDASHDDFRLKAIA